MNAKPTPIHPPTGLAQHEAEARRRIVETLLPHFTEVDELLEVAEWVYLGPEDKA
ncbi:hypothetical protein [Brachybacterium sp.]|uniref:hypothetical protein n=1 Tax=Brachybacterium sp. TaxID=1891286 RepID=UPI002ED4A880